MDNFEQMGIPKVMPRHYWLVRTSGGQHYADFTVHGYIAIAWDYLSLELIKQGSEESLKKIIAINEKSSVASTDDFEEDENGDPCSVSQVTTIYNKVVNFVQNFSVGDIAIIPNKNTEDISIGIIKSEPYENSTYIADYLAQDPDTEISLCPFVKRRKVQWLKGIPKRNIDIYLLKAFSSHHAISNVDEYADYINREIYSIYTRGNELHSIIRAGHPKGMSFAEFRDLAVSLGDLFDSVSLISGCDLNENDLMVKLNIHSPGLIEIIAIGFSASMVIATAMFSWNHFLNGSKTHIKFKYNDAEFEVDSETKGLKQRNLEQQQFELKKMEHLAHLSHELQIAVPEITPPNSNNVIEFPTSESKP